MRKTEPALAADRGRWKINCSACQGLVKRTRQRGREGRPQATENVVVNFRVFWVQMCLQFMNWALIQPPEELSQYVLFSWTLVKSEDSLCHVIIK